MGGGRKRERLIKNKVLTKKIILNLEKLAKPRQNKSSDQER